MQCFAAFWTACLILGATGCLATGTWDRRETRTALLPAYASQLHGAAEIRVENSQYFSVIVGVRSGDGGADVVVPAGGRASLSVPPGAYELYFVFASTPGVVRHNERVRVAVDEATPATIALLTTLPPCASFLPVGRNLVMVRNSNPYSVDVALRAESGGADLFVPAMGSASVSVPDGTYDVYFVYSTDLRSLYQGDTFTTTGHRTTISLEKVVGGNYGIRKVH